MKPESAFRNSIHKKLPSSVYHEASSALFSNGTPDDYYEAKGGFARIEYKHYEKLPVRGEMHLTKEIGKSKKSKLSAAQQRWLNRSFFNGLPVYVIVGFGRGRDMQGVVLYSPSDWSRAWKKEELEARLHTTKELAELITENLIEGVRL